jgi:hypothetical protein
MKKLILLITTLLLLLGCETGVQNKGSSADEPVLSGIVDRNDAQRVREPSVIQKSNKQGSNKIFSKTAQPGYYLQFAFFAKNRPSKTFLASVENSGLGYIVLAKHNGWHVLIGPYISYNGAKKQISMVKTKLKKQTFVVQVLRP